METIDIEDRLGIAFCNKQALSIERGEGSFVWDENNVQYLDFTSGWGVTCLGHSHPVILAAISSQARKIIQNPNSGFTYSPTRSQLLAELQLSLPAGLEKIYFANSGAEVNDAAIKIARKVTGKSGIVSTNRSFHGRTFNTLSVSQGEENTNQYLPHLPENKFVEFGNVAAVEAVIDSNTAALIVEPIQGEGGVRIPPDNYLSHLKSLCAERGILLIVDEVQTGFCRTGKFFAFEHDKNFLRPDILTMGKGIAGGYPFAAFAVTPEVNEKILKGDHGGTYCGNPLGCAVALEVVRYLKRNNVARRAQRLGRLLISELKALARRFPQSIQTARGCGLLAALELDSDFSVEQLSNYCLEQKLLVTPTRNRVIRLIPSLLVTEAELKLAMERLTLAFTKLSATGKLR